MCSAPRLAALRASATARPVRPSCSVARVIRSAARANRSVARRIRVAVGQLSRCRATGRSASRRRSSRRTGATASQLLLASECRAAGLRLAGRPRPVAMGGQATSRCLHLEPGPLVSQRRLVSQGPKIGPLPGARFPSSALDVRRRVLVRWRRSTRPGLSVLLRLRVLGPEIVCHPVRVRPRSALRQLSPLLRLRVLGPEIVCRRVLVRPQILRRLSVQSSARALPPRNVLHHLSVELQSAELQSADLQSADLQSAQLLVARQLSVRGQLSPRRLQLAGPLLAKPQLAQPQLAMTALRMTRPG